MLEPTRVYGFHFIKCTGFQILPKKIKLIIVIGETTGQVSQTKA